MILRIFYIVLSFMFLAVAPLAAQRSKILSPNIASLQVVADGDWLTMPVTSLNGGRIDISFDELSHTNHRFTYRVEHCEADWTVSEGLFDSDYIEGFAEGNTIDDNAQSLNTNTIYTHYSLSLPNEKCALKLSGNYKLTVFDDDNDDAVLTACFMVSENIVATTMEMTTNTDMDVNMSHQQIGMSIDFGSLRVTDLASQVKTVVLQNGRWDNAKINTRPQYQTTKGLRWTHNRELIFDAGNEYHKFETLATSYATMGVDHISWDGANYHAYPFASVPRPNYLYDEDANGSFLIRNSDNTEVDYTCDYMYVHFQMNCPEPVQGDVYVNGKWTYDRFLPQYKMEYDYEEHCYKATVLLKQGYYSYQYLMLDSQGTPHPMPYDGNFFQTENEYHALVYYRQPGGRTDRLVGYQKVQLK